MSSISTRHGDEGYTCLNFNRQVPKSHPVVHTVGSVDSLQVSLGVARVIFNSSYGNPGGYAPVAQCRRTFNLFLRSVQERLITLMGEVSTVPPDWPRYDEKYGSINQEDLDRLDRAVAELDPHLNKEQRGWSIPGDHPDTACLERARVEHQALIYSGGGVIHHFERSGQVWSQIDITVLWIS